LTGVLIHFFHSNMPSTPAPVRRAVHVLLNDVVLAGFQLSLDLPEFEAEANSIIREATASIEALCAELDVVDAHQIPGVPLAPEWKSELRRISEVAQARSLELLGQLQAIRALNVTG
jgi:hypothetical protein